MQFSKEEFDLNELLQEARNRWLKPPEVLFILQNHERCRITSEPLNKPQSGSLYLFNRRVLRFFRKDGHKWRRKKDGRTSGEGHERLKVGGIDTLNCYYAHGEENPKFQRRSYWMLDKACEHIVLVHYMEVSEVRWTPGSESNLVSDVSSTFNRQNISSSNPQNPVHAPGLSEVYDPPWGSVTLGEVASKVLFANDCGDDLDDMDRPGEFGAQSNPDVKQTLQRLAEQLRVDDDVYYTESHPLYHSSHEWSQFSSVSANNTHNPEQDVLINLNDQERDQHFGGSEKTLSDLKINSLLQNPVNHGKQHGQPWSVKSPVERKGSPSWKEMLELCSSSAGSEEKSPIRIGEQYFCGLSTNGTSKLGGEATLDHSSTGISHERDWAQLSSENEELSVHPDKQPMNLAWSWEDARGNRGENGSSLSADNLSQQLPAAGCFLVGSDNLVSPTSTVLLQDVERPLGLPNSVRSSIHEDECHVGIFGRETSLEWTETKDINVSSSTYSPEYHATLFDQENHLGQLPEANSGLTIAQVQRFTIQEISPEWAYSTEGSKVIVIGDFLCGTSECAWCCMFGDVEVPLEIIQKCVLRCQAPPHVTGKVSFYITSGNREPCSEIKKFEYRFKPDSYSVVYSPPKSDSASSMEELLLLVKFAQMLLHGNVHASTENDLDSKGTSSELLKKGDNRWDGIIDSILDDTEYSSNTKDWLLQELLKVRLDQWLSEKRHIDGTSTCSLTKHEQGIIHMIASLGYEWALSPVLNSGVLVNFRDNNGWTALHWAARFGREGMVAALLAAGAFAGAVTDPTSQEPAGRTAAAIASANGHKGLAACLSEVALTSHLSSLTLDETEISEGSAAFEAEKTVESISERRNVQLHLGDTEEQLSLKDSLAAIRNAVQAAAHIQSAFRAYSFRNWQQKYANSCDECGLTQNNINEIMAASKHHRASRNVCDHKLDIAATCIQRKYLSWKGQKDFLKLRRNVVKIQAHVRGHQARKKYKEFLWTAGVLEKVILRWRRKGIGLRGFRTEQESNDEDEDDDILKLFRKQKVDLALNEAVSRVLLLIDCPNARQQYRRMLESYRQAMAERHAKGSHGDDDSMEADDLNQF